MLALMLFAPKARAIITCTTSASTVVFGTYNPFSATATDSAGNVQVQCHRSGSGSFISYIISLSKGGSGTYTPRYMFHLVVNHLNYNLYTTTARVTIWGDGTSGTSKISDSYSISGNETETRNYIPYGRIPALQNIVPGTYTDTITVTVTY